jgi:hypothetical protein
MYPEQGAIDTAEPLSAIFQCGLKAVPVRQMIDTENEKQKEAPRTTFVSPEHPLYF